MAGWNRHAPVGGGLAFTILLLAGCSSSPGRQAGFLPQGHRLSTSAKQLRHAMAEPQLLPRELAKQVLPPYAVEPGDVLLVQPTDLDSPARLPGDQPVLLDGTINLGRYGRLMVAGKTLEQIEAEVRALVEAQTKDAGPITARVITRVSKTYFVLGDVNSPGEFPLSGREAVLNGIVAAGGLTDRASRANIILSRPTAPDGCRVVLPICYDDIVQVGDTATNYQLAPGDRIYVPTRTLREQLAQLLHRGTKCSPCGGPHFPCFPVPGCLPSALPGAGDYLPPTVPESEPIPAPRPTPADRPVPQASADGAELRPGELPPVRAALTRRPDDAH